MKKKTTQAAGKSSNAKEKAREPTAAAVKVGTY